jgi:hypothetical protein
MDESWFRWALGLSEMSIKPEIWRNYNHIYWHIGRFPNKSLGLDIAWGAGYEDEIEMHLYLFRWRFFLSINIKGRFDES